MLQRFYSLCQDPRSELDRFFSIESSDIKSSQHGRKILSSILLDSLDEFFRRESATESLFR